MVGMRGAAARGFLLAPQFSLLASTRGMGNLPVGTPNVERSTVQEARSAAINIQHRLDAVGESFAGWVDVTRRMRSGADPRSVRTKMGASTPTLRTTNRRLRGGPALRTSPRRRPQVVSTDLATPHPPPLPPPRPPAAADQHRDAGERPRAGDQGEEPAGSGGPPAEDGPWRLLLIGERPADRSPGGVPFKVAPRRRPR